LKILDGYSEDGKTIYLPCRKTPAFMPEI